MQEKFYKVVGKVLNLWERLYRREKVGKVSNSRKGYSMTISELEMGRKGKGKERFQSLPYKGQLFSECL